MGIEFQSSQGWLGECSIAGWKTAARMLPGLVEAVNIRAVSAELPFAHRPNHEHQLPHPPFGDPFSLDSLIEDRSSMSEVRVLDVAEFNRFLEWCDFLVERDIDSIGFYAPLLQWLTERMHVLDR